MKRLFIILSILTSTVAVATAQYEKDSVRMDIPTHYFEKFIGTYQAPDSIRKRHPQVADRPFVTISYDTQKRIVHFLEGHGTNKDNRALEGLALWNPHSGKIEFTAYNSDNDFLFKGEYSFLSTDSIQRIYDVHYPITHEYYKMGHAILTFRETMKLSSDNTRLHNKVEYFNKKDGNWLPWSNSILIRTVE